MGGNDDVRRKMSCEPPEFEIKLVIIADHFYVPDIKPKTRIPDTLREWNFFIQI